MNMKNLIFGAIVLTAIFISVSMPCSAAGELVLMSGSAKLNSTESMALKNGYVLTIKTFEFNTTTAAKKINLILYKNGAIVDEKNIVNIEISNNIGYYIYYKNIGGRSVKILRADLDMWTDETCELENPGKLCRGVLISNVCQYWDGDSQAFADPHIRFLWIKGLKGYNLKEVTLEKVYENNVTLNSRSGILVQHNQNYNESFDARNTVVEITKNQSKIIYPSGKNFQGERKNLVILDEDNSFPIMNEDDIFICRVGELSDPSVLYNISDTGSVTIITPAGDRSTVNFTIPDWGATEVGYIYQNMLTSSIRASSNPDGASIFIDGMLMGKAPATLQDIPLGTRIMEMQLENNTKWRYELSLTTESIKPVAGHGVRYVLGAANAGLNVNSTPGGAKIYADGYYIRDTPALISGIPQGNYSVELQLEGYKNWTKNVSATDNSITEVSAALEKSAPPPTAGATATANITATPTATPKAPGFEAIAGILALFAAVASRKK